MSQKLRDKVKSDLIDNVKGHTKNQVQMLRWFFVKENITIPPAFTDAQVDAIWSDIRTHDE